MADQHDLVNLLRGLPPEVIREAYGDLGAPTLKQFGRFGEEFVKALRLALFPIQLMSALQDRVESYLDRAIRNVPDERLIIPMQSIALPIIEKLRFQEPDNIITELYINLLSRAMDGERVGEAHPAFVGLITQMAPDEVLFLQEITKRRYTMIIRINEEWITPNTSEIDLAYERLRLSDEIIAKSKKILFNYTCLNQPELFYVFLEHLWHTGLVEYTNEALDEYRLGLPYPGDDPRTQPSLHFIRPTSFGKLFYRACVPEPYEVER
jgi:hypothetical protein